MYNTKNIVSRIGCHHIISY